MSVLGARWVYWESAESSGGQMSAYGSGECTECQGECIEGQVNVLGVR